MHAHVRLALPLGLTAVSFTKERSHNQETAFTAVDKFPKAIPDLTRDSQTLLLTLSLWSRVASLYSTGTQDER